MEYNSTMDVVSPAASWRQDARDGAPPEPPRDVRRAHPGLLIAAALALGVVGAIVLDRDQPPAQQASSTSSTSTTTPGPMTADQIYAAIQPSVVLVEVELDGVPAGQPDGLPANLVDDPTDLVDDGTEPGDPLVESTATGVIVNADGSVLTALHVVAEATSIGLTFADGTETTATIAASDPATDMAVLVPERLPEIVVPAVLGGAGLAVGDTVVAVGHPLGLVDSTTQGVVSGMARTVRTANAGTLRDLIQFDAAVNPGSSGGPLVNDRGEVVGIVTALANPAGQGYFIGIGFAVPITAAAGGAGPGPQR